MIASWLSQDWTYLATGLISLTIGWLAKHLTNPKP